MRPGPGRAPQGLAAVTCPWEGTQSRAGTRELCAGNSPAGNHHETPRVTHVTPARCSGTCCFPGKNNSTAPERLEQPLPPHLPPWQHRAALGLRLVSGPRGEVFPSRSNLSWPLISDFGYSQLCFRRSHSSFLLCAPNVSSVNILFLQGQWERMEEEQGSGVFLGENATGDGADRSQDAEQ